jgi:segregation and condensation protein B
MTTAEIKAIAESLLFASGTPLSLRRIAEVIGVVQADVRPAIALLREEYAAPGHGIRLAEVAGGYQFRTVPEYAEYVKTLVREKPNRLSRAALETLAIIAYRQPITKVEIETVRGVDVDGVLNSLMAKKLVRVMGRKDVPGRPWVYGTTPQFLEVFGLSELASLPPLPDIHEPTVNPYGEHEPSGTSAENSESSGTELAPGGGGIDSAGASPSEWKEGHPPGNDSGPTARPHSR